MRVLFKNLGFENLDDGKHLAHIDGLRCLALCGVLFYHLTDHILQGGFAGVDMFLCLSGFLITRKLRNELTASARCTVWNFYRSRFLRLHPPLTATVLVTIFTATLFCDKENFMPVVRSGRAALLMCANRYFRLRISYFNRFSNRKPLLHLWSLSLEEQFYFSWAIFMYFCAKRSNQLTHILYVTSLSLLFAVVMRRTDASYVFYELPARLFQFSAGALCSYTARHEPERSDGPTPDDGIYLVDPKNGAVKMYITNIASGCALAIVMYSFATLPIEATPLQTLALTLSTCVLVLTPSSWLSRVVFTNRASHYFAQLSYAIYLVHWPVVVLGKRVYEGLFFTEFPVPVQLAVVMPLSVVLKRYVEDPFRRNDKLELPYISFLFVTIAGMSYVILRGKPGYLPNFPTSTGLPAGVDISKVMDGIDSFPGQQYFEQTLSLSQYRLGNHSSGTRSNVVFMGDSFTWQLMPALNAIAKSQNTSIDVHFAMGFPLVNRNASGFAKMRPLWKHANDLLWMRIDNLRPGDHLVITNFYERQFTAHEITRLVQAIRADLKQLNVSATLIGHPAGVRANVMRMYVACRELSYSPFGKILREWRNAPFDGAGRCLRRLGRRLPPRGYLWVNDLIFSELSDAPDLQFFDLTTAVCTHARKRQTVDTLCDLPPQNLSIVYDIGYALDGYHLTPAGAYHLTPILGELFQSVSNNGSNRF